MQKPEEKKLEDAIFKARNSLSSDRLDMSFGELISMYTNNELVIDPEFQRLFRWDKHQQTRFIESLLLGIPIPSIFIAEDNEGRWELVDGLQRMSTILSFFGQLKNNAGKNSWALDEGDIVKELGGFDIERLPLKFRLNIKRSTCRIEIIKWDSEYDLRFELFNRLNTGGSPLADQEVRNCIFRGISVDFTQTIKDLAAMEGFINLIQPTERQKEQLYPDELVLRFFSLFENHNNIKKKLSEHMTDYMKDATEDKGKYEYKVDIFKRTLHLVSQLGKESVRGENGQLSTSLYDGIFNGIAANIDYFEEHTDISGSKVEELKQDEKFREASGQSSNYKERTKKRITRALEVFSPNE